LVGGRSSGASRRGGRRTDRWGTNAGSFRHSCASRPASFPLAREWRRWGRVGRCCVRGVDRGFRLAREWRV